jgi:hypothetical protein
LLNVYYGELVQLQSLGELIQRTAIYAMICGLGWSGDIAGVSESAVAWLGEHPAYVPPDARPRFSAQATP